MIKKIREFKKENISAVIFDMDGVLLDSESVCDKTWKLTAKELKLKNAKLAIEKCRGTNKSDTILILKELYGNDFNAEYFFNRTSELFKQIEFSKGLKQMYFADRILQYLKPKYKLALASSTRGEAVKRQLTAIKLIDYFNTLTTGELVVHSKPNPEIYTLACNSICEQAKNCVAIEDSANGVKSAFEAGMNVILVPDRTKPTAQVEKMCNYVCTSLKDVKKIL